MTKNTKNSASLDEATNRPRCINPGCDRPASYTRRNLNGTFRWRVTCSHCQKAAWGGHPHRPGVTPYKTGHCCNQDGRLGFRCFTDLASSPIAGLTEIDHIDGDHCNNDPGNLQELCQACHAVKGRWNRDFARGRCRLTQIARPATIGISKREQSIVKDSRDKHSSSIQLGADFPHRNLQYTTKTTTKERPQQQ